MAAVLVLRRRPAPLASGGSTQHYRYMYPACVFRGGGASLQAIAPLIHFSPIWPSPAGGGPPVPERDPFVPIRAGDLFHSAIQAHAENSLAVGTQRSGNITHQNLEKSDTGHKAPYARCHR